MRLLGLWMVCCHALNSVAGLGRRASGGVSSDGDDGLLQLRIVVCDSGGARELVRLFVVPCRTSFVVSRYAQPGTVWFRR